MVDAVAAWDLDIVAERFDATDLEGDNHVVGAVERGALVGRGLDPRRKAVVGGQLAGGRRRPLRAAEVDVHQRVGRPAQLRKTEEITHQPQGEDDAARPDHRDLRHVSTSLVARSGLF